MALKELDTIPELRDDPSLKDFNDVASLAKSHVETKKFVGSSIRPPGPDATPEARAEFYKKLQTHAPELVPMREGDAEAEKLVWQKLGRPEKPEEYEVTVPDGVDVDVEALRTAAKEAGLTKSQFKKLAEKSILGAQKMKGLQTQDHEALRTEWGQAYDHKLKNAASIALKLGESEQMAAAILAGRLPSAALKRWDAIAKAVGTEGGQMQRQNGGGDGGPATPAELRAQFKEVQNHPAYFNRGHPEHDMYVEKGKKLMEKLSSG